MDVNMAEAWLRGRDSSSVVLKRQRGMHRRGLLQYETVQVLFCISDWCCCDCAHVAKFDLRPHSSVEVLAPQVPLTTKIKTISLLSIYCAQRVFSLIPIGQ
jgi:hypothetical protein